MPEVRGKKKTRRARRRLGPAPGMGPAQAEPRSENQRSARRASPPQRQRFTLPFWANIAVGGGMLVVGIVYYFRGGLPTGSKLLLLAGYAAVAAFYLARAFRQYRARRGA